jgi:hypothetical protein
MKLEDLFTKQMTEIGPFKRKQMVHEMIRRVLAANYKLQLGWG